MNVVYSEGDYTARFVPQDELLRVIVPGGTPTYEILDLRVDEDSSDRVRVVQASATVDSTNLALAAAAGPATSDEFLINLSSVTGLRVGSTYRLESADGRGEDVIIASIDTTSTNVETLSPIRRDYPITTSNLLGVELSCTIPAALVDDEDEIQSHGAGPFAVIWRYTEDGIDYRVARQFFLSRYSIAPQITPAEFAAMNPGLARRLGASGYDLLTALRWAQKKFVADLEKVLIDPAHTLFNMSAQVAVSLKTQELLHEWMSRAPGDRDWELSAKRKMEYEQEFDAIVNGKMPRGTSEVRRITEVAPSGAEPRVTRSGFFLGEL